MDEEWGPMIEHDGRGCPCVGQFVRAEYRNEDVLVGIASGSGSWSYGDIDDRETWSDKDATAGSKWIPLLRYRVKVPRALAQLRALIADLPQTVVADA